MRGLVEIKLLWLLSVTLLINSNNWLSIIVVLGQFLILLIITWSPQKVALFGYASILFFGAFLGLVDFVFNSFDPITFLAWILIGSCYIILYEYTALYEVSSFLSDYKIPRTINVILNFGFRFIPVAFDATHETYLGLKAKNKLPSSKILMAKKIMPSLLIMILYKFEQMWISYNIRLSKKHNFDIVVNANDYLFSVFFLFNVVLLGISC